MGSPNFRTDNELLVNFAVEAEHDDECLEDSRYCSCGIGEYIAEQKEAIESFINSFGVTFFHNFVVSDGYHSGFQVYIIEARKPEDLALEWTNYKEFSSTDGYNYEVADCVYFKKGVVNATLYNCQYASKSELKTMLKALTKLAREQRLGELVGKTWTSSVSYDWLNVSNQP